MLSEQVAKCWNDQRISWLGTNPLEANCLPVSKQAGRLRSGRYTLYTICHVSIQLWETMFNCWNDGRISWLGTTALEANCSSVSKQVSPLRSGPAGQVRNGPAGQVRNGPLSFNSSEWGRPVSKPACRLRSQLTSFEMGWVANWAVAHTHIHMYMYIYRNLLFIRYGNIFTHCSLYKKFSMNFYNTNFLCYE